MSHDNGSDQLTYVVVIIDHSPEARVGNAFLTLFERRIPDVETVLCTRIEEYEQVYEFIYADPTKRHILSIFDWPMPHQVEDHEEEAKRTIEVLWKFAQTRIGYREQYMYCVPVEESLQEKMMADPNIYRPGDKLPYLYFSMLGGLASLIKSAHQLYLTASGQFIRPGS